MAVRLGAYLHGCNWTFFVSNRIGHSCHLDACRAIVVCASLGYLYPSEGPDREANSSRLHSKV